MSEVAPETRERIVGVIAAVILTLLVHHPALRALGTAIPGEPASDALRAAWSVWLVAEDLPWPFSTPLVNFPAGVHILPFPALTLLLGAPLAALFGPVATLTLLIAAHTVFAALACGALVRTLGGGRGGALLAGALVISQPILGGALRDGTLEVMAVGWVPLTLWAMVLACRGSLRHGALAAVFFLCTCLESVYYGSFTALGVLFALATLRGRRGLAGAGVAALGVAIGAALLGLTFRPVIEGVREALASANQEIGALQVANAAKLDGLIEMARVPGARGWKVGDLYAPPLAHWGVFGLGGLLALRRAPWLTVLGAVFLLLALNHPAARLWIEGPLGEVVRLPRRYMAVVAVCLGCGAGVGLRELLRWPKVELGVGAIGALILAVVGTQAAGLGGRYPLVSLPRPAFAAALAQDDEDCAALFLPLEVPGESTSIRTDQPVFAGLGSDIASADLLVMQLRSDKAGWYTPSLATLTKKKGPTGLLPKNFTNLARPKFGAALAKSATLPAAAYTPELEWLRGEGLKYVVVDTSAYRAEELAHVDAVLRAAAVAVDDYADGTGVRVYRLYDQRPARVEAPAMSGDVEIFAGFMGTVVERERLIGRLKVRVRSGETFVECPVHPGDNRFECNVGDSVDEVTLFLDDQPIPAHLEGSLLDARIVVDGGGSGQPTPPAGEPPKFTGVVENYKALPGRVEVEASLGDHKIRCPIRPETGRFDCGRIGVVVDVRLLLDGRPINSVWDQAQSDAHIRVER